MKHAYQTVEPHVGGLSSSLLYIILCGDPPGKTLCEFHESWLCAREDLILILTLAVIAIRKNSILPVRKVLRQLKVSFTSKSVA